MAEAVVALFALLPEIAAGGAAAAEGAGAAATGAAALSAGAAAEGAGAGLLSFANASTAFGVLSGVASGFSALAAYGKGVAGQSAADAQAQQLTEAATTEGVVHATDAMKARQALLETVGKQAVGYAASGIDLSAGTVKVAQQQASDKSDADLSASDTLSQLKQQTYLRRAAALQYEGTLAYASGELGAFGELAKGGAAVLKRG
jgi:hypothetical protein